MMLSRLLSGHLLITIFGIQFLVAERGFRNAVAAVVLVPFGLGYFAGTAGGGWFVALLERILPDKGRTLVILIPQQPSVGGFGTELGGAVTEVDVVVVGGGAMGSAGAWQLARRGRSVVQTATAPTTTISGTRTAVGEGSPEHLVGASRHLAQRLVNVAENDFPGQNHFAHVTDPSGVADAIRDFLHH